MEAPRFDALTESYLSGSLAADEETELDSALRGSAELRETFLDVAEVHRLLEQELRSEEAMEECVQTVMRAVARVAEPRDPARTARGVMRSVRRRARRRSVARAGKVAGLLAAAASLLFAGYVVFGSWVRPSAPSGRDRPARAERPEAPQAEGEPVRLGAAAAREPRPVTEPEACPEDAGGEPSVAVAEPPGPQPVESVELVPPAVEVARAVAAADGPSAPTAQPREHRPSPVLLGRVRRSTGTFLCRRAGESEWSKASGEAALCRGDWLDTRASRLEVRLARGGRLYLNSGSSVGFEEGGLFIEKGVVYAEIVPGQQGYFVRTPNGRAAALGTKFLVEHTVLGTTVAVVMGRVACSSEKAEVALSDGQELRILEGQPPGRPRRSNLPRRLFWVYKMLGPMVLAQHVFREPVRDLKTVEGWDVVTSGACVFAFFGEDEWDDYRLEASFRPLEQGAKAGLAFRARGTDWKQGYLWLVEAKKKKVRLCPCAKLLGRAQEAWETRPLPVGQWTHMAVEAYGKEIWLYRDDDVEKTFLAETPALRGRPALCVEGKVEVRWVKVTRIPPGARR